MSPFALLYYYIGFPGLGIKDFHINSTAISFGNLEIKWYGLIIVCGMIAAVVYTYLHARRHGLIFDDIIDIALAAIIPGVIGARLYYVFFDWLSAPEKYKSFYDVVAIWEGGLAIYGGLIFGVLGAVIALKIKKIRIPMMLDCAFPGILLAQSMGRWGNFFNMEAYGAKTTWFCRMRLSSESGLVFTEVHPTFLYESIWNLIGFVILTLIFKKRKFDGQIFLMAVSWYGFGRFFIEGLRQDSLWLGKARISQVLAGALFVAALTLLIVFLIRTKKRHVARCIYTANSSKYVPLEVTEGDDPDYDYDMSMLYAKKSASAADTKAGPDALSVAAENTEPEKAADTNIENVESDNTNISEEAPQEAPESEETTENQVTEETTEASVETVSEETPEETSNEAAEVAEEIPEALENTEKTEDAAPEENN